MQKRNCITFSHLYHVHFLSVIIGILSPPGSARFAAVGVPHQHQRISDETLNEESKSGAFKINDGAVVGRYNTWLL